jgi:transposase-like protein
MNDENSILRKYKRYDENFKRSAVEMWLQGGKSAAKICRDLGITTQSLKLWKKQLAALPATGPGQRSVEQLEAENRRLQREIHRLAQQRDILKTPWV